MVVQLAKQADAEVIRSASPGSREFVAAIGAERVVTHTGAAALTGIDVVVDPRGGGDFTGLVVVLRLGGIIVTLKGEAPRPGRGTWCAIVTLKGEVPGSGTCCAPRETGRVQLRRKGTGRVQLRRAGRCRARRDRCAAGRALAVLVPNRRASVARSSSSATMCTAASDLAVAVGWVLPLADAATAHELGGSGQVRGRLVWTCAASA